jgi:subtilisin family serine protease
MNKSSIAFALVMTIAVFAPSGAAATISQSADSEATFQATPAPIDPALQDQDGVTEVVVRFDEAGPLEATASSDVVDSLQDHADRTQQDMVRFVRGTDGVKAIKSFWLVNAMLVEVDRSEVDLDTLARVNNVDKLHANFEVELHDRPSTAARSQPDAGNYDTTYGVEQVNATEVWEEYGTKGEGVKVAVLDTGVANDHPDIDLYTEDPDDPTYPGGWAEFDSNGNIVPGSEPHDTDDHGTHTSGTVSGGNASGEYIGVAPNVDLMHGLVIPGGGGSFTQVAAGMEWAVNQSADVISMSLGAEGYFSEMIEPVQNAEAAGTIVVSSSGNSGEGTSGSPGNVYEAIAVGASNEAADIADFSSGEEVDTAADWGSDAPSDWPDSYVVPDVAAPGVSVKSAVPGGGYEEKPGTSMAAPHVAGTIALMLSAAGGDVPTDVVKSSLRETAWKPADQPAGNDTRYGAGIVDAKNATDLVALESGVNGTVTDADGDPIEGATVTGDNGFSSTTDASGAYEILAESGDLEVTAEAFGYAAETTTVTVPSDGYATADFSLDPALDLALLSGQADAIQGGDSVSATVQAANVESVTVELVGDYDEADATLLVNGQEVAFGEPVEFGEPTDGELTITVETAADTEGTVELQHTFEGLGDSITVTTGPTDVFENFKKVAVVDEADNYGPEVKAALEDALSGMYQVDVVTHGDLLDEVPAYDVFVVESLPDDESLVQEFVDATETEQKGVVYLDNWGSYSDALTVKSDVTGDPASVEDGFSGDLDPQYVNMNVDHPIFEGVDASDPITIHTSTFSDHAWFNGTDLDVIADVTDSGSAVDGSGIAVDDATNTVYAATLGRSYYVGNDDFTEAADTILANAVVYAGQGAPEPEGVLDLTDDSVQPGENAKVTLLTDVGGVAGYEANVSFDPEAIEIIDVTGIGMSQPVYTVDEDEGYIHMAQAQASGIDAPTFVELTLNVTLAERGQSTTLDLRAADSRLNDENGSTVPTTYNGSTVKLLEGALGDVNMDGEVTAGDATLVQRYIVGLPIEGEFNENLADVNGDGEITSADVTAILQIVVGEDDGQASNASPATQEYRTVAVSA